jgi:hypothetical protein
MKVKIKNKKSGGKKKKPSNFKAKYCAHVHFILVALSSHAHKINQNLIKYIKNLEFHKGCIASIFIQRATFSEHYSLATLRNDAAHPRFMFVAMAQSPRYDYLFLHQRKLYIKKRRIFLYSLILLKFRISFVNFEKNC